MFDRALEIWSGYNPPCAEEQAISFPPNLVDFETGTLSIWPDLDLACDLQNYDFAPFKVRSVESFCFLCLFVLNGYPFVS